MFIGLRLFDGTKIGKSYAVAYRLVMVADLNLDFLKWIKDRKRHRYIAIKRL